MTNIFVSIASYRDSETIPTIQDILDKAKNKNRIKIGLCLQEEENTIEKIDLKKHIKTLYYHWKDSLGTCWARHLIQKKLFNNEQYYLQIDSHHRFVEHWDEKLINLYETLRSNYKKPIIGGYCPSYYPDKDEPLSDRPLQTNCFPSFTEDGDLLFSSKIIHNFDQLRKKNITTIPARFLSGHFIFTSGNFCKECLYDPNLYFRGEELSLSVRAFTHGYDFFHPVFPIVWHQYIRKNQPKHWNDHTTDNGFIITASQKSAKAKERVRLLLGMEKSSINFGKYGLGKIRTIHDYELYSGLSFKTKQVHKYAYNILGRYPFPFKMDETEWSSGLMKKYSLYIHIPEIYLLSILNDKNIDYITISCENMFGYLIYKKDIKNLDLFKTIHYDYHIDDGMESRPEKIYIYPHYSSGHYGEKFLISNFKIK